MNTRIIECGDIELFPSLYYGGEAKLRLKIKNNKAWFNRDEVSQLIVGLNKWLEAK